MIRAEYRGDGRFAITADRPIPPGPGEVRVAVAYTGICGTDLHIAKGHLDRRVAVPGVIGHEMSGRVAAVGRGVTGWSAGDPVTVMPLDWCGSCPACRAGHTHICHRLNFIGVDSAGSMRNSWTVPAEVLVGLPPDLPLHHAALVEPTAVAVHDVRRAQLRPGEKAVVVGAGPVGLLIAVVARAAGADVLVAEPDEVRRRNCADLGFPVLDPFTADVCAAVGDWTDGAGAAVAFEVSGAASGVADAIGVLGVRGRLVLVAIHATPREVDLHRFFWRELTLVGVRVYQRTDFLEAVGVIARGEVPIDAVVSKILPLARVAQAFDDLQRGAGLVKVLLDCSNI